MQSACRMRRAAGFLEGVNGLCTALSLRSVTAVLEAPLRNGGQLMDWAYVLLHRPDDCGVAMNSNFFPSYHPKMRSLASWAARTPGKRRDATTRTRRCRDATGSC